MGVALPQEAYMSPQNCPKYEERAGRYVPQAGGYKAFLPKPLPPDPPLEYDPGLTSALSQASWALGRLEGSDEFLRINTDLFVAMYVRKEAVLSSQVENTQATLEDVIEYQAKVRHRRFPPDVSEVVNYVRAMNTGLARLAEIPLSLRLIREMHATLLEGVRGADRRPGEFRTGPNWIGPKDGTIHEAVFVPPPVAEMHQALGSLEEYLHREEDAPALVKAALVHAQFETIHPFADGNGRLGRLLITLFLCEKRLLRRPLLYLSRYFVQHRGEYYDRLMAVRLRGDWEGWLKFFLTGVHEVATEAADRAVRITGLRQAHEELIRHAGTNAPRLLDLLYVAPVVSAKAVRQSLGVTAATAHNLIRRFEKLGLLKEITGKGRNRAYRYQPYVDLLNE